jgi:hypothetical protein
LRILAEIYYKLQCFTQRNLVFLCTDKCFIFGISCTYFRSDKKRNQTNNEGSYPPPTIIIFSFCYSLCVVCDWFIIPALAGILILIISCRFWHQDLRNLYRFAEKCPEKKNKRNNNCIPVDMPNNFKYLW